jgi:hypothetical protein
MKNILLIFIIFPIFIYGQNNDYKSNPKVIEIDTYIQLNDSLRWNEKEEISEGVIKYDQISGKFGYHTYFLNDSLITKQPYRIRHYETNRNNCEELNLYYKDGKLIFAEQFTKPIKYRNSKFIQRLMPFYFYDDKIVFNNKIYSEIDYNENIFNIVEKANEIRKMIYK